MMCEYAQLNIVHQILLKIKKGHQDRKGILVALCALTRKSGLSARKGSGSKVEREHPFHLSFYI